MNDDKTYTGVVNELERLLYAMMNVRVHPADEGRFACLHQGAREQVYELRKRGRARFNARKRTDAEHHIADANKMV